MKKKTIIFSIILITLMNILMPVVHAVQIITKANLINDHKIDTHLLYFNEQRNEWRDIQCGYICYIDNGQKYPAYCIVPNTNGVDEEGSYTVTVNKLVNNKLIYNILINGYPYKTPAQLGVEADYDAYVATKLALKNALLDRDVTGFYKAADARGEKTLAAMFRIIEKGKKGNSQNKDANIYINKVGKFVEKGEYYYQEYNVSADVNISEFSVKSIEDFPEGTFVIDTNGNKKDKFSSGEKFRVMIPKSKFNKDITGKINITASCNTNPIFYGEAPNATIQDYAVTYKPYVDYSQSTVLNENTNTASIKIVKQDAESLKPIKDVIFGLYNQNNEHITSKTTNAKGIVIFDNLYQGTYKVKEIQVNENYILDDTVYEISTEYNKETIKNINNTHKKGNLKITKVDKDDNSTFLEGIEFDLIDSNNKVIALLITDANGEAFVSNINIGKYTLKETKTKENYNLCIDNNVEVKWNETAEVKIENEKKKGQIKIIKQDAENSNIKLEGVEFEIIDSNNKVVDKVVTDSNGIAVSSRLPIGEYKIKETSIGENHYYILNEEELKITVEDEKTNEIVIKNYHKKGNLKITKVDKDDNYSFLDGIEFDLIDSNNKVIAHLITDANGEALVNNINIGKYTLKETKTKEKYNLCIDNNIEVNWNETAEVKIENEKKKGQIKIIKQDAENSNIKLEGVEFEILDTNNKVVDKVVTDSNGIAVSSRLPIGEYKIKETSIGENHHYILNEEEFQITVEDEKINEIVIKNYHKKGNLKITKVDKDDKTITLGAIEFDLINQDGNVIFHLVTDVNGEVYLENINTGTYTLKETKTKREYNLCENTDIVVEWNKTLEKVIENEKKKGQIKIVKQDADKAEIKLEGVKFQIIDINDKVVEEIITNKNGEAISSKLLIGEYKVKEIDQGNNTNYLLNDGLYNVTVDNQLVTELIVENEHKKGSLKIIKTDKDNSDILLEGVKFEITDKDGFKYEAVTNKEGIAQIDNIRVGKISVKEIETNNEYVLNKEIFEYEIKYNECVEIELKNEKKKGQLEIYKVDKNDKNIKIPNVEFEILDINNKKVVDKLITNEQGYAISKLLPIGKYYVKETRTDKKYVLNDEVLEVNIEYDKITSLNINNKKVKGKIKIIKTSSNDSPILNIKQGEFLEGVKFEIFNSNNELVDSLITDKNGQAISKELEIGRYKVIEKSTNKYYILNKNEFFVNIENNNEIKTIEVENEAVIPKLDIEKIGQQYAEKNEEIKYEFDIKNISNTKLDDFTWIEYIPYEKCKITKMVTGIYNQNLDYEIYYKTNYNNYRLLKNANSLNSEYINFDTLNLEDEEIITEIKVEYETVNKDFASIVKPCILSKIDNHVKKDDRIINITELSGRVEEYVVRDKSSFETIINEKEILKKLPKTGC